MSTLIANGQEEYIGEKPIMTGFVEKLTQQGVENAADYIFIYTNDWRKGQAQYAKDIDAYIDEVRALTCSDKVDIYGSASAVNAVPLISIITAKSKGPQGLSQRSGNRRNQYGRRPVARQRYNA